MSLEKYKDLNRYRKIHEQTEALDRPPIEFAHLIGASSVYPFEDGKPPPNKEDNAYMMAAGYNPYA